MKITIFILFLAKCLTCFGQVEKYDLYMLLEKNHIKERTAYSYFIDSSGNEIKKDKIEVVICNSENKSIYLLEPKLDRSHSYFYSGNGTLLAHSYRAIGKKDSTITNYNYITNEKGLVIRKNWIEKGDTIGYELTNYNDSGKPVEIIKKMYAWTSKFEYSYDLNDRISKFNEYEIIYIDTGMAYRLEGQTFYDYDSLGRKIKSEKHWWQKRSRNEMISTHLYVYDDKGKLTVEKVKDGDVQYIIKYKYDLHGNLIFKGHYDILDNVSYPQSWMYDIDGNLIETVDQGYKDTYQYNSLGLCVKHIKYNKEGNIWFIKRYFYENN